MESHRSFNKPVLPQLHGTFHPPPNRNTPSVPSQMALRRTDLMESVLTSTLDCPPFVGGVRVVADFRDPNCLIDIDYKKLGTSSQYQNQIQAQVNRQQIEFKSNHLHSWFHPNVSQQVR